MDAPLAMTIKRPIGIYDSGIGGLSVLDAVRKALPQEDIIYYADTLHLPYGTKSPEQIQDYSRSIIHWMQNEMRAKTVIAACHTSSALALDIIAPTCHVPLIGTIKPLLHCVSHTEHQRLAILATPASVESRSHERFLRAHGFTGHIVSIACPYFVPLIESTPWDVEAIKGVAMHYLQPIHQESLDSLLYGCTHYPFIHGIIADMLPPHLRYINPADAIANEVASIVGALSPGEEPAVSSRRAAGQTFLYCSSNVALFRRKVQHLTHLKKAPVRHHALS